MPTYEYFCKECHLTFECHTSIENRDKQQCCLCDGEVERGVGCGGFELKGPGWERDNYASHVGDAVKHGGRYRD